MTQPLSDFDHAFRWLSSRTNYETMATQRYDERTYGLARVHALLDDVGRPDQALDIVQVVGSKGKGSTAVMAATVLGASGRRTGLYTSPHLVDARERIVVDGRPADDALVVAALERLRPHVDAAAERGAPCTFFEIHTVAALLTFAAAGCDAAVLEAGMGGRLDATTAARARGVALTSVSLDHTTQLGTTAQAVAREKAAAARSGVPLVCGVRAGAPGYAEIAATCETAGAPLVLRGRDFDATDASTAFDVATGRARTDFVYVSPSRRLALTSPLLGLHQAENAALAVALVDAAGLDVSEDALRTGLATAAPPARLQTLSRAPLVLLDGAHSPASFRALAAAVREAIAARPCVFVVGMAADKDVAGALAELVGTAAHVVTTTSGAARAATPGSLAAAARAAGLPTSTEGLPADAIARACALAGPSGVVVVTGSLYLCGAVLGAPLRLSTPSNFGTSANMGGS